MKTLRTPIAPTLAAIAALLAIPAIATAADEAVVPPSNSAAAQYTEAFPTSGGDKKTDQAARHRSPIKVLGSNKTKKLENQGPEGRAAAEAAAATAPSSIASSPSVHTTPPGKGNGGGGHRTGGGGNGAGNSGPGAPQGESDTPGSAETVHAPAAEPAGSSGLGSAVEQATGLSTGGRSGPLLLLVIAATVLWSLAYLWRRRQQVG